MMEARTTRTRIATLAGEWAARRKAAAGVRFDCVAWTACVARISNVPRSGQWAGRATAALALAGLFFVPSALADSQGQQQAPAPIERRAPPPPIERRAPPARAQEDAFRASQASSSSLSNSSSSAPAPGREHEFRGTHGEHLAVWLNRHSNLNLQQQEQALGQEPGFANLPPETQQRYRNRLAQLDAMNPQRRQSMLARNEALERLSPGQRAQVRAALGGLGSLPPEQRGAVAQTFNALRRLPANERPAAFSSGRFGPPLNGPQQAVLINLLTAEPLLGPMLPPRNRLVAPPYPQNFPNGGMPSGPQYPR